MILELKNKSVFQETFEELYRNVHSIKGSAGTHGLHSISTISHYLEEWLNKINEESTLSPPQSINHGLEYVDLLRQTLQIIESGTEEFSAIEQSLQHLRNQYFTEPFRGIIAGVSQLHTEICLHAFGKKSIALTSVENGYQALDLLLQGKFDVLITGMQIPVLNGLSLIAALRLSDSQNRDIQTIMLTSDTGTHDTRYIDPDYLILKNHEMPEKLETAARQILETLNGV
jgi:CheY-like chemotaxis protein